MNPEFDNEAYMKALRAKYGAKKITTEDEATRVNNLYDARRNMLRDSEMDDVNLGADFISENTMADAFKDVDKNLSSLSDYQVDPMDMDEYDEKSDYEYWAEDDEKDATLMHTPENYLSEDESQEMPVPPPSESMEYGSPEQIEAVQAEHYGPGYREPNLSKPTPAAKTNPYGAPNATFESGGYRHEYYNDGRRLKTPIEKPGTGVSPGANMRPGNNG